MDDVLAFFSLSVSSIPELFLLAPAISQLGDDA
jgi:hypothetical protein